MATRRSSTSSPARRMPPPNNPCYTTPTLYLGEVPSPNSTSSGTRPSCSRGPEWRSAVLKSRRQARTGRAESTCLRPELECPAHRLDLGVGQVDPPGSQRRPPPVRAQGSRPRGGLRRVDPEDSQHHLVRVLWRPVRIELIIDRAFIGRSTIHINCHGNSSVRLEAQKEIGQPVPSVHSQSVEGAYLDDLPL
jgi:hypothetical protein